MEKVRSWFNEEAKEFLKKKLQENYTAIMKKLNHTKTFIIKSKHSLTRHHSKTRSAICKHRSESIHCSNSQKW